MVIAPRSFAPGNTVTSSPRTGGAPSVERDLLIERAVAPSLGAVMYHDPVAVHDHQPFAERGVGRDLNACEDPVRC